MRKVLIYGMGKIYEQYILAIKWHERSGMSKVLGVMSNEHYTDFSDGYCYFILWLRNRDELNSGKEK